MMIQIEAREEMSCTVSVSTLELIFFDVMIPLQ